MTSPELDYICKKKKKKLHSESLGRPGGGRGGGRVVWRRCRAVTGVAAGAENRRGPSGKATATAVDTGVSCCPHCYSCSLPQCSLFFLFTPQILLGNRFYSGGFHYQSEADGIQTPTCSFDLSYELQTTFWLAWLTSWCRIPKPLKQHFLNRISYIIPTDTWQTTPIPIYHQCPSSATVNNR